MRMLNHKKIQENMASRFFKDRIYKLLFYMAILFSIVILLILLFQIFEKGVSYLSLDFFTNFASRNPKEAGIAAALSGTILFMSIVIPLSFIFGVGTALYLEQYAKESIFKKVIEINNQTLAGVPSVVFGLLGLTIFVYALHLGESIIAAGTDDELTRLTDSCCSESRSDTICTEVIIRSFLRVRCYEVANDVSSCIAICVPRNYNRLYVSDIKSDWRSGTVISYRGTCICKLCSV